MIIKILDILSAILIVTSLFLVEKYYQAWIMYTISCVTCAIVYAHKSLPGMTIMGLILFFIGLKNYFIGRKRYNEKKDNR